MVNGSSTEAVREWRHKRAEARKEAGVWGRKPSLNSSRTDGLRQCAQCKQDKPESDYYKSRNSKTEWFSAYCKPCCQIRAMERRKTHPKPAIQKLRYKTKRMGTTPEWFNETLAAQGGVCAICKSAETHLIKRGSTIVRSLAIDHDHATGKPRGLLCFRCNTSVHLLDKFGAEWLKQAAAYLRI